MKYRKTALVDAEQFLPGEGKIPAGVYSSGLADPRKSPEVWLLSTMEGEHQLRAGDYICTGPAGERWNVAREIFEATYERVPSSGEPPIGAAGEPEAALSATDTQITQPSHDDEGLIERLEEVAHHLDSRGYAHGKWIGHARALRQAANTISRLKGERDEANAALVWIYRNGFRHSSECPPSVVAAFNAAFEPHRQALQEGLSSARASRDARSSTRPEGQSVGGGEG